MSRTPHPRRRSRARFVAGACVFTVLAVAGAWTMSHDHPAPHHTPDARALALYLSGRREWGKRTKAGLDRAVVLFRQASDRDPTYAAADAGLADAYAMLGYFGFAPPDAMFPKARAAAMQALQLDPRSGDAYAAIGQVLAWQHQWSAAERAYRRSIALDPNDATAHQWYALLLAYLGRSHEAAVETGKAARLDPLSVQINNMYGMMLYYDGDVTGALRQFERTVFAEPDSGWVREDPWVLSNFARVAGAAGRHAEAIQLVQRALQTVPGNARLLHELAVAYIDAGDTTRGRSSMARMNPADRYSPVYRGLLEARMGQLDSAFAALDAVKTWPLATLVTMNNEPGLARLRADSRFRTIRARLGM